MGAPAGSPVTGFEVEIESDVEASAFARILATVVNGSPVHLERVVVAGTVVYPVLAASVYEPRTLRLCRFTVRRAGGDLDRAAIASVLTRIAERFPWTSLRLIRPEPAQELLAS